MENEQYIALTLDELIEKLRLLSSKHFEVTEKIIKADDAKIFALDLLAVSVAKRSISLVSGFTTMIKEENFICAAPLLRLQLDNALRFFAAFLVEDPHELAKGCIDGVPIKNFKDRKTKEKLTDAYLVKKLGEFHEWIADVYKDTSGYIHLSEKHFYNAFGKKDEAAKFGFAIGEKDQFIGEKERFEAVYLMFQLTSLVLWTLNNWALTKEAPTPEDWLAKHGKENINANWGRDN